MSIFKQGTEVIESKMSTEVLSEARQCAQRISKNQRQSDHFKVRGAEIHVTKNADELIGDTQITVNEEIFFVGYAKKKR